MEMLRDKGTQSVLVDRYKFREMLDASVGDELWPRGVVTVLSDDFAKQTDIRESLGSARWDMVIGDEAHRFAGVRAELLRRVVQAAERVVLATMPGVGQPDTLSMADTRIVDWRRDQLVDLGGKALDVVPRPVLREVSFPLNPAERAVADTVSALCDVLKTRTSETALRTEHLIRSLHSSPAALEGALRRLVAGSEEEEKFDALLEDTAEIALEGAAKPADSGTADAVPTIAGKALHELEAIQSDSKLGALAWLLAGLTDQEKPLRRICVLTEYRATLYYLAADMEGRGLTGLLLHGGMRDEARQQSLRTFVSTGGILVATMAVMTEGLSMPDVTDLVLYDLPGNPLELENVLGRFDRFGRTSRLNVHVLAQGDAVDSFLQERLRTLRGRWATQQGRDER
jgi:hypothetical protein